MSHIESGIDAATRFPDFDLVSEHLQSAGQCVQYVAPDGSIARSNCIGFNRDIGTPPAWFAALCDWIPSPQADVVRPISYRDKPYGSVVVMTERAAVVAAIWKEVSGMLGLTALVIGAICMLQDGAISRVLRPTKDILAGLDRLALADLSSRLPHFRLIELQRISEAFNTLAANLERTTREKMQDDRIYGALSHQQCAGRRANLNLLYGFAHGGRLLVVSWCPVVDAKSNAGVKVVDPPSRHLSSWLVPFSE